MRSRIVIVFFLSSLLIIPMMGKSVFAENLRDILTKEYRMEKDICPVVKKTILSGMNTKEVTRTCVEMGHDACLVVRCAIEARGSLEQIITGAIEAGASSDVCSRCAMKAGADPKDLARILEAGLGYSTVAGGGLTPIEIGIPGGNTGGGVLSSSRFR